MTSLDDFDRALGEFLRDGPSVAPEPPVIAALAHARATPRGRDPFAALRRDVMARPLTIGGLRPGLALAAAAFVVAGIGIAIVGGSRNQDTMPTPSVPVVAPSANPRSDAPTETPRASIAPSVTPTPLPRLTSLPPLAAPAVTPVHVQLEQCCADDLSVDVVDESGHLVRAASGPNVEGGSVQEVTIANDDPRTLRVTWPGSPCDTVHRLTIDPAGTSITVDRPQCFGDALPADRIVVLTFDVDVDAASIQATLVTARGGVDLPSWTATGIDKSGTVFHLVVFDASQSVTRAETVDVSEIADVDPTSIDRSQIAPDVVRMLWSGPPCDTTATLRLDVTARDWRLEQPESACGAASLRGVDLTFTGPLDAGTLR